MCRSSVVAGVALVAAVVAPACGGATPGAREEEPPSCQAVAEHLVRLDAEEQPTRPGARLEGAIRGELEFRCLDLPWSAERRRCLAAARDQDATLGCPRR
jgi:hypothetical protein